MPVIDDIDYNINFFILTGKLSEEPDLRNKLMAASGEDGRGSVFNPEKRSNVVFPRALPVVMIGLSCRKLVVFVLNLHVLLEVDGVAAHHGSNLRLALDVDHLVLWQAETPGDVVQIIPSSLLKTLILFLIALLIDLKVSSKPEDWEPHKKTQPGFPLLRTFAHLKKNENR